MTRDRNARVHRLFNLTTSPSSDRFNLTFFSSKLHAKPHALARIINEKKSFSHSCGFAAKLLMTLNNFINPTFSSLSICRTRNSANGFTKWITANSDARASATRSCDAADRRREWNVATRHSVDTAPAATRRRPRRSASYSWTLCEYTRHQPFFACTTARLFCASSGICSSTCIMHSVALDSHICGRKELEATCTLLAKKVIKMQMTNNNVASRRASSSRKPPRRAAPVRVLTWRQRLSSDFSSASFASHFHLAESGARKSLSGAQVRSIFRLH